MIRHSKSSLAKKSCGQVIGINSRIFGYRSAVLRIADLSKNVVGLATLSGRIIHPVKNNSIVWLNVVVAIHDAKYAPDYTA